MKLAMNITKNKPNKLIITRMAPSPTGTLHIGTARTALFNYLFATHHGGKMILRIEDTDKERSKREFETEIVSGLNWLGIKWSNKPFYRQSERTEIYLKHLETLLKNGGAYLSKEESKKNPGQMVEVVRLKNPNKKITFTDEIRGEISFDTTELGDLVIARSMTEPLYHFVVVVDDEEMGVNYVIRGEDHISNTPRQILIQEALGFERPVYAHLPLILAPDKTKLSKRHGAVSLSEYKEKGFSQVALVNYLTLLGWSPGTDQEIFTWSELITAFSLEGVQKAGAIFNEDKLKWFNKQHLNQLPDSDYAAYIKVALDPIITKLEQYSEERFLRLLPTIKERVHIAAEAKEAALNGEYDFAFSSPEVDLERLTWRGDKSFADCLPRLEKAKELLTKADFSLPDTIKDALWSYAEEVGKGELLWPLRVALTGLDRSPDPFTCAYIIGSTETDNRLEDICVKIKANDA